LFAKIAVRVQVRESDGRLVADALVVIDERAQSESPTAPPPPDDDEAEEAPWTSA